ncbi:MAG: SAM-dependent methyltransferase [Thermoleophilia bacterium]
MRDYERWHQRYDDPASDLSWRLGVVRGHIRDALDRHPGPVRALSLCAGDGRDLVGVLAGRPDADRVRAVLVEVHPAIAERGRAGAAAAGVAGSVEVRQADAGDTAAYADAVPADLVLLVGIMGNITDEDLARTIAAAPGLCAPGATLVWTRGRASGDRNDVVRARLAAAGFAELAYDALDEDSLPAVGAVRYDGPAVPLPAGRLFTFRR